MRKRPSLRGEEEQTQLPHVVQTIQLIPDPPLPGINLLICQDHVASGHTCSTRQLALNKSAFATVQFSRFAPKVLAEDSLGSPREQKFDVTSGSLP